MARAGLIGCLHRSDLDMPALWHHIFRQLNKRVSEIRGAKQTQMYGGGTIGEYAVRPVNKTRKMSEKIRLRSILNLRFLLCPRGKRDEKQAVNHAEGQKPWEGETLLSTAIAIVIVAQSISLSESPSVASPRCRVQSQFAFGSNSFSTFVAIHCARFRQTDYICVGVINIDNAPR